MTPLFLETLAVDAPFIRWSRPRDVSGRATVVATLLVISAAVRGRSSSGRVKGSLRRTKGRTRLAMAKSKAPRAQQRQQQSIQGNHRHGTVAKLSMEVWEEVYQYIHWKGVLNLHRSCFFFEKHIGALMKTEAASKTGHSNSEKTGKIAREICAQLRMPFPPNVLFLFVSPGYCRKRTDKIVEKITKRLPKDILLLGARAPPVSGHAVSAMAVRIPGNTILKKRSYSEAELGKFLDGCERATQADHDIILSNSYHDLVVTKPQPCHDSQKKKQPRRANPRQHEWATHVVIATGLNSSLINGLCRSLQDDNGKCIITGGVAPGGLIKEDKAITVLSIGTGVSTIATTCRGAKPIGNSFKIVAASGNRIQQVELPNGVQDTMSKILFDTVHAAGGYKEQNPLLLGISNENSPTAEYTMSQIFGISLDSVITSVAVEKGQYCQFFLQDSIAAGRDISSRLSGLQKHLPDGLGSLLLFQTFSLIPEEVQLSRKTRLPFAGMSCSSEIGPLGLTRRCPRSDPYDMKTSELLEDLKTLGGDLTAHDICRHSALDRYTKIFGDRCIVPQRSCNRLLDTKFPNPSAEAEGCSVSSTLICESVCEAQVFTSVALAFSV